MGGSLGSDEVCIYARVLLAWDAHLFATSSESCLRRDQRNRNLKRVELSESPD